MNSLKKWTGPVTIRKDCSRVCEKIKISGVIKMPVRIESSGQTVTAYLEGELDHHTAREIRETIDAELENGNVKLLIIDFRDVTFMDSSGIGLVMGRYRQMKFYDGELQVVNTSPQIYKVMRIAGLDRLAMIERSTAK